jgi:hypothetical protein
MVFTCVSLKESIVSRQGLADIAHLICQRALRSLVSGILLRDQQHLLGFHLLVTQFAPSCLESTGILWRDKQYPPGLSSDPIHVFS